MKPLGNQPFDFGFSDTCECGENEYEQFFFKSDTIQVAFEIEPCEGNESFETNDDDFDVFAGALTFNGSVVTYSGTGALQIFLPNPLTAGRYLIQFNVLNYTSGTLSIVIGGVTQQTITPYVGINSVWVNFATDEPTITFTGNTLDAEIDFQISYQEYQSNQDLYLVDASGNEITNFDKFYRDNYVIFGGVPFSGLTLTDCLYRLRWVDECDEYPSFQFSNFFKIVDGDGDECTIALSGCFPGAQLGFPEDYEPLVRLSGRIARPQYTGEVLTSRDSEGYTRVNYLDREKTMQLLINLVPEYILDFISVWIGFEQMYINGQSYRIADDSFPEINYPDGTDLGQLEFTVKRVRQNIKRINCFALESPCDEVPPPPNLGTPKEFQDDEPFEFMNDEQFNFE